MCPVGLRGNQAIVPAVVVVLAVENVLKGAKAWQVGEELGCWDSRSGIDC